MYWNAHEIEDKKALLQLTADKEGINQNAVEKDWWVTVALKALFQTSCSSHLLFKGGTSLSKGWNIIERFSEDIDLAINHTFFGAEPQNNNQLKLLRKKSREYIHDTLSKELKNKLDEMKITNFEVENVISNGIKSIDSDSDPTVIYINYISIIEDQVAYIPARIKIEISCLSMAEPSESKEITSLIHTHYPDQDDESRSTANTVLPSRTFLEKAFLLNEEFQKEKPRHLRMSRHLYDLEKIMDTEFGEKALSNPELYEDIVKHRKKYYHLSYMDYQKHHPSLISFCPPEYIREDWSKDYDEMKKYFIYGATLSFEELICRIRELTNRFQAVETKENLLE